MEKVEQTICIYIRYISQLRLAFPTLPEKPLIKTQLRVCPESAKSEEVPWWHNVPATQGEPSTGWEGAPPPAVGPMSLPHCWDAVGRGTGKKPLPVGYLFPIAFVALKLHQGPELLYVGGWWRSTTIFPFIYSSSRFLLSMQLQQVLGNELLSAFSALEVHNVDVYLRTGRYLLENKKSASFL